MLHSTGGTEDFIKNLGIPVIPVEDVTSPLLFWVVEKNITPKVFEEY
jgi:phosphoribosylaminoimidazolecarboxamide formyltransferase/IMP cyclohydrolase